MGAKRTHLQRRLGWVAAAVVLLAVTARAGEVKAAGIRTIRRRAQARAVAVSQGDRQRVTCTYPTEVRTPHSRRSWDTGEQSPGRVETERRGLARPIVSLTSYPVSSITPTSTTSSTAASSTTTSLSITRTTPTSSNRSPRA
jgi:hypothetical protein